MNRIALFSPYFGEKLPSLSRLILRSWAANSNIDFIIYTDCIEEFKNFGADQYSNIKLVDIDFKDYLDCFKEQVGLDLSLLLNAPRWHICKLKPVLGECFSELLQGHDFWGYIDIDVLLGQTDRFLTGEVLDNYDLLPFCGLVRGNLLLLRNSAEVLSLWRDVPNYEKMLTDQFYNFFDERIGELFPKAVENCKDLRTYQHIKDTSWIIDFRWKLIPKLKEILWCESSSKVAYNGERLFGEESEKEYAAVVLDALSKWSKFNTFEEKKRALTFIDPNINCNQDSKIQYFESGSLFREESLLQPQRKRESNNSYDTASNKKTGDSTLLIGFPLGVKELIAFTPCLRMLSKLYKSISLCCSLEIEQSGCLENCPYVDEKLSLLTDTNGESDYQKYSEISREGSFDRQIYFPEQLAGSLPEDFINYYDPGSKDFDKSNSVSWQLEVWPDFGKYSDLLSKLDSMKPYAFVHNTIGSTEECNLELDKLPGLENFSGTIIDTKDTCFSDINEAFIYLWKADYLAVSESEFMWAALALNKTIDCLFFSGDQSHLGLPKHYRQYVRNSYYCNQPTSRQPSKTVEKLQAKIWSTRDLEELTNKWDEMAANSEFGIESVWTDPEIFCLPQKPSIKYIQIFGERGTGTNYLQSLIFKNFPEISVTNHYGHKHWPTMNRFPAYNDEETLFLILSRNPYHWARSIYKTPWHAFGNFGGTLPEFLEMEWKSYSRSPFNPNGMTDSKREEMCNDKYLIECDENILKLRNRKNLIFVNMQKVVKYLSYLRYEDLLSNPQESILKLASSYKIRMAPEFKNETRSKGFGIMEFKPADDLEIDPASREIINSHLDWNIEKLLGYEMES